MKKIKYIGLIISLLAIFVPKVYAANASINVSANAKTIIVGNTVKVSVKVSSKDLGSWEYCISYDSNILKLTDSTADANTCVRAGVVQSKGQTSSTETFTFKALKSGNPKISVKSYAVYGYSTESQMSTSTDSVTLKTMTQSELEATYSKDSDLKSLSISNYKITPEFSKDKTEYSLEVENKVESITINATKNESHASVTGTGTKSLVEGNNKFEIKVTAQKGNTKTYVINVIRKELNPIKVNIDNKEYTLVRKASELPTFKTFEASNIDYDGEIIPALYSNITKLTIVGVKDENGNILMFIYDNNFKEEYFEINMSNLVLYPLALKESDDFNEYIKVNVPFNSKTIEGYKLSKESKQAVIYAKNIETDDVLYYLYDEEDGVAIKYSNEINEVFKKKSELYKIIILSMSGVIAFLLIIIILAGTKKKKKNRKKEN